MDVIGPSGYQYLLEFRDGHVTIRMKVDFGYMAVKTVPIKDLEVLARAMIEVMKAEEAIRG